jgi:predicted RNA-binding Zn ribbon-like protein
MRTGVRRSASFMLILCVLAAGCYSTSYVKEATANATLLMELADKLDDYCRADFEVEGRQVSAEEMGEFYYALDKARSWAATVKASKAKKESFIELEAAYELFLRDADRYRLTRSPDLETLAREHDAVASRARAFLKALGSTTSPGPVISPSVKDRDLTQRTAPYRTELVKRIPEPVRRPKALLRAGVVR